MVLERKRRKWIAVDDEKEIKLNGTTVFVRGVVDLDDEKVIAVWISFGRSGKYSDILLYCLDPEVLLSGFLPILKSELGRFGMVSSESTQEKVWSSGWRHLLDSKIGRKIQKES